MHRKKAASAAKEFRVPSLAESGGDVAVLVTRRAELKSKAHELELERQRLWSVASTGPDEGDEAVAELLGDEPDPENPSRQRARDRLSEIARETQTVQKAISVLDSRMHGARMKASATIIEAVQPEYRKRVRAVFDALMAARAAHIAYAQLVEQLNMNDVAWTSLVPLSPHRILGDPHDSQGAFARWIREAAEAGYIAQSDIPEALR